MSETIQMTEIQQALDERRFGKLCIPKNMIDDVPHRVQEFFHRANFLVLEAEYVWEKNAIEYLLVHPKFSPTPHGQVALSYALKMRTVKLEEGGFETQITGWNGVDLYEEEVKVRHDCGHGTCAIGEEGESIIPSPKDSQAETMI